MIYKMSTFKGAVGWYAICDNLVGKGHHGYWNMPAIVLGIPLKEFVRRLIKEYGARVIVHTDDRGQLSWLGYYWLEEDKARKFINGINLIARKKKIMI